jgi:hypothetical protein
MADTVKLPLLGQTSKGTIAVSAVALAGVGGYLLWKHLHKPANTTPNTPPAGSNNTANSYGYGQTPSANSYGYGEGYGYAYTGGGYGSGIEAPEYAYGTYSTNAQWSQSAEQSLVQAGYSSTTVLAALGLYLTGGSLSASQVSIIQQAIAVAGYPPTEGPGGYPPSYHTSVSTGQSGGGGTSSSGNISVPNVVGQTKGNAHNLITAAKLTPWDGDFKKGDAKQKVVGQQPAAGTQVSSGTTVTYVS